MTRVKGAPSVRPVEVEGAAEAAVVRRVRFKHRVFGYLDAAEGEGDGVVVNLEEFGNRGTDRDAVSGVCQRIAVAPPIGVALQTRSHLDEVPASSPGSASRLTVRSLNVTQSPASFHEMNRM